MSIQCLFCASDDQQLVVSLGAQPLANSYLSESDLLKPEPRYPLDLYICRDCFLAHIEVVATSADIFSDYAYFSSFAVTWLEHARRYVDMITGRLHLDTGSHVIEVASNDGYLLQNFVARGIPCLGVEPAANVAAAALEKGIPTEIAFWGEESARRIAAIHGAADLIVANNVLAHVPTLNDFVEGFPQALKDNGVVTLEFPHLYRLLEERQFDTIYHEHFSYFALFVVEKIFAAHGLRVFDVEELTTHGGSLRVYACKTGAAWATSSRVPELIGREKAAGLDTLPCYERFAAGVAQVKAKLIEFLEARKAAGDRVAAYGAPAKGNTLLNYCGVSTDLIAYTVDRSPHKQGKYLPGTHIPIFGPDRVREDKPDYLVILPWNLRDEVMEQMSDIRAWGGKFVIPLPEVTILP